MSMVDHFRPHLTGFDLGLIYLDWTAINMCMLFYLASYIYETIAFDNDLTCIIGFLVHRVKYRVTSIVLYFSVIKFLRCHCYGLELNSNAALECNFIY